jgi:menaquinone-dependent protoporphyrinogen oxidase
MEPRIRRKEDRKMTGKVQMNRRDFIMFAGGTICASALPYRMATASNSRESAAEFIESKCEKDGKIKNRILIAYSSRCGSTGGIADAIGQVLCGPGTAVDVRLQKNANDLTPYQAVIAGSAIRMGKWLPEAVEFVKTHRDVLRRVPVAYFVACLTMKDDTAENRSKALAYLDPVCKQVPQVKPVDIGLFAGAIDFSKLSFVYSSILRVKGAPEGDFRNWEAIRTWAAGVRPALLRT